MIVVDTSVWVDYFNGVATNESEYLDKLLGYVPVGIGDLIVTELLQGFRLDRHFRRAHASLSVLHVFTMLGPERAVKSAENYRQLRKKGISIRKTADVIIATFCIEENHQLLFSDRDFQPFVRHLGLKTAI